MWKRARVKAKGNVKKEKGERQKKLMLSLLSLTHKLSKKKINKKVIDIC